ncbi:MAG: methyltransferase [Gammaproteobacteria bacterium]|nr:MAG: methyltransferase [Gammaproteobacteria bacterium]
MFYRLVIRSIFCSMLMAVIFGSANAAEQPLLLEIINGDQRTEVNKERDRYRHPQQTLEFFGIQSEMTVVEIWPGKGWYTEILAPFIKQGNGQLIAAGFPQNAGPQWRQTMQRDYQNWLADSPAYYDQVKVVELGPPSFWQIGPDESVDAVLTFRNVHNWLKGGYETEMFNAFYHVLKPGGVLGITDHRAQPGTNLETMKQSGYLNQDLVVILAQKAGFVLEAVSEINANPLDDKQHPKGVWTLPPTLRLGEQGRDQYLAIGESDRMTLRFRKLK